MSLEHGPNLFIRLLETKITHVELDLRLARRIEASAAVAVDGALSARLGLVHTNGAAVQLRLVHLGDGLLGRGAGGQRHEAEPAGSGRAALHGEKHIRHLTKGTKLGPKLALIGRVVQISNV